MTRTLLSASRSSTFSRPIRRHATAYEVFGQSLDTPFGPAAGPHSQMAQNIIAAWLCGARYIELKTVQTLDELDVSKPCIDMEDEGYNVEWSQELKVHESFEEYLRAWVLIHALHHKLGYPGDSPALFNLSVGYDLAGIRQPNMQWFLDNIADCSDGRPRSSMQSHVTTRPFATSISRTGCPTTSPYRPCTAVRLAKLRASANTCCRNGNCTRS